MSSVKLNRRCPSAHVRRGARFVAESLERRLCLSAATFAPAVTYAAGGAPFTVAVGDFNRDGKPDLVVAALTGGVDVLLGNGNGTFKTAVSHAAGNTVSAVVGDFNGDGKPDLAVADFNGGADVLLGNGNGTFKPAVFYAAAGEPVSIAVGDFNGDGKVDLALAADSPGVVDVLLGNGNGTFKTAVSYPAGILPNAIAAGNFNGDSKTDLVVADYEDGVDVLVANGNGTLKNAVSYTAGNTPYNLAVGDLNGDGKPDLAVADANGGVDVLLGNGNGTFKAAVSYAAGNSPQSVAVGDFNGDGKPDLAVADFNGGVSVLLNTTPRVISTFDVGTSAVVGTPLRHPVATFHSNFPDAFTATINYGDGAYGPGAIKSEGGGKYAIFGSHTYSEVGNDILSVTLSDKQGPLASAQGFAAVREAPLKATGATGAIAANGVFSGVVARFTDPNPHPRASEFFGTIYWGDGSSSAATFVSNPSGGFEATGSHTFSRPGPESPLVVISDPLGTTATVTATLTSALPTAPTVTGFDLILASTGNVRGLLSNNQTISLSALHITRLDIGVLAAATASMTFSLNGKFVGLTSKRPFTLLGADSALSGGLPVGRYSLIVQPFSQVFGRGVAGAFTTIHFKVVA